jgi:hypothetical protein
MEYTMRNVKMIFKEGNAVFLTLFLSVDKEANQVNTSEKGSGDLVTQNANQNGCNLLS